MVTQNSSNISHDRASLSALLRESDCWIVFTKKDGSKRTMLASLRPEEIGDYEKKTDRVRAVNEDILPVWDIEAGAWRSVVIDNILSVEVS